MKSKVIAAIVASVVIVAAIGVFLYFRDSDGDGIPDFRDQFPDDTNHWKDSDGDGVPDSQDVFPFDPTETADFDRDGIGDNADPDDDNDSMPDAWEVKYSLNPKDASDATRDGDSDQLTNAKEYATRAIPTDPDSDDDVVTDGADVDPAVDVIVAFQYTRFRVEDPVDIGTQGDVYYKISMGQVELQSSVIYYDTNAADIPVDYTVIFNVPDNQQSVHFRTTWIDKDLFFDDELDASGIGNAVDVDYALLTHTWTGDDTDGIISGNDDGSTTWDEDDITLWYRIFDSVGHPDEIEEVLSGQGSSAGLQDFSQAVRTMGHLILEWLVDWAQEHPSFFGRFGTWGSLLASGLGVLALAVKYYRLVFLQNDDR